MRFSFFSKIVLTASFLLLVLFLLPHQALAQTSLIQCGTLETNGMVTNPCTTCDVFSTVQHSLIFIWWLATPVLFVMLIYGGALMVISGFGVGASGMRNRGKTAITNTIVGIILVFVAWIAVDTVIKVLAGTFGTEGPAVIFKDYGPWNNIECKNLESFLQVKPSDLPQHLQLVAGESTETNSTTQKTGEGGREKAKRNPKRPVRSTSGKAPLYKQEASPWGNQTYGDPSRPEATPHDGGYSTYGDGGCGPTSVAMALSGLGWDVTPPDIGDIFFAGGARIPDQGTNGDLFKSTLEPEFLGLRVSEVGFKEAKAALLQHKFVIASVGHPSIFTVGRHYILLTGFIKRPQNSVYLINDPKRYISEATEKQLLEGAPVYFWILERTK